MKLLNRYYTSQFKLRLPKVTQYTGEWSTPCSRVAWPLLQGYYVPHSHTIVTPRPTLALKLPLTPSPPSHHLLLQGYSTPPTLGLLIRYSRVSHTLCQDDTLGLLTLQFEATRYFGVTNTLHRGHTSLQGYSRVPPGSLTLHSGFTHTLLQGYTSS